MLKKLFISFALTFFPCFIGIGCAFGINVYAYTFNVVQSDFDTAPIADKSSLQDAINNAFTVPTSDYYIDFYYDYNNYYDDGYIRVYYQNNTNSTPLLENNRFYYLNNSNSSPVSFQTFNHNNAAVGTWSLDTYQNSWSSSFNNSWSSSYNITLYIIRQSVPCVINNQQYDPPEEYTDEFYSKKDNYSIKFGVAPTRNSEFLDHYYVTQNYTAWLSFRKGSTEYNYTIPSLAYINVGSVVNITQKEGQADLELLKDKPYLSYWKYMRGVRVSKFEFPATSPPTESNFSNLNNTVTFQSDNIITLRQLLGALNDLYLGTTFVINDLYTDITISFKNIQGQTKYSKVISWSENHTSNDADAEEPPPDEAGIPDQTKDNSENNENLDSNNYYLDVLANGENYISNGMSELIQTAPDVNNFTPPDYQLAEQDLDSDAMDFFTWLVTFWYTSPFGIIAMLSLTFLIIKVTVWR